eukprot:NODE_27454_length_513_cov_2.437824.p3 GENE.NODE_27454_length_513_cov_2.437824~~NODE_27454_length_513_cov_2.437824.p3  ORF type:complete len:52 (-),score=0.68 NODE_27454_length_513_cov_2.437824:297-452(-)
MCRRAGELKHARKIYHIVKDEFAKERKFRINKKKKSNFFFFQAEDGIRDSP